MSTLRAAAAIASANSASMTSIVAGSVTGFGIGAPLSSPAHPAGQTSLCERVFGVKDHLHQVGENGAEMSTGLCQLAWRDLWTTVGVEAYR